MNKARSLYVHFPFCRAKCHYCDFYSSTVKNPSDELVFYDLLRAEAALRRDFLADELETLYFGGGTPSLADPRMIFSSLQPVGVSKNAEFTIEANPFSVTRDFLRACRETGINRISLGVQALRPELLSWLGRIHTRDSALAALGMIFDEGFTNVSVDLLCGVPGQTIPDIEEALGVLCSFPVTHVSCYLLTLRDTHRLHCTLPDENTQLDHFLFVDRRLCELGFRHYEISSFARAGFESRHNLNYWHGDSYLGFGPSAHSFDASTGRRWKNSSIFPDYGVEWEEFLTPEQKRIEALMLAARLDAGFTAEWIHNETLFASLMKDKLIERHPQTSGFVRLTPKGFVLSDAIVARLI
ncbi:MAG: hypothetical protein A2583_01725 [Bdellovibrionales bacterium RIFOXYD1_FULL_53_11]|nr:MAG: hypothetical protein A2583_01725 [Bdellovibrionales bacterium RIFOXYD1_FULL_53_11]